MKEKPKKKPKTPEAPSIISQICQDIEVSTKLGTMKVLEGRFTVILLFRIEEKVLSLEEAAEFYGLDPKEFSKKLKSKQGRNRTLKQNVAELLAEKDNDISWLENLENKIKIEFYK